MVKRQKKINISKEQKVVESIEGMISRRTSLFFSIVSLGVSFIFLSQNITGNAVATFSTDGANWIGGIFFVLAIIAGLVYVDESKGK